MVINYHSAIIFSKHTNLLPWFCSKYSTVPDEFCTSLGFNQFKNDCAKLRDVQLILLVRFDNDGHTYCKIKCPVNPLPIKGEFEVVSLTQIIKLLQREGWTIKQKLPVALLK